MPRLLQFASNTFVEAAIRRNLALSAIEATDNEWLSYKERYVERQAAVAQASPFLPEHFHWRWSRKVRFYQGRSGYEFLGIECENRLQGILLLDYTRLARPPEQIGLPLVYIDYLATAPWNLPNLTTTPEFTGVGRALFVAAYEESLALGFQGRIGLHSLPQSEGFYQKLKMIDMGQDRQYHDLHYFERE